MPTFRIVSFFLFAIFLFTACNEVVYTPKPRGYPRINFPEREYQSFDTDYCQFTFEYPAYAEIERDESFFDEAPPHPCWFDLNIPTFNGKIYLSYAPITKETPLDALKSDAFRMTDWHNKKATYIEDQLINRPNVRGIFFNVEGPAASPFQFYITDSLEQHFVRGALYLDTQARPDSLAPVYDFLKPEMEKILETFTWLD